MKRYLYSKSPDTVRRILLPVLFALLPFVFTDKLIETETTFRFAISGVVISFIFLLLLISLCGRVEYKLPSVTRNYFYLWLLLYLVFIGFTISHTINKGEGIYDYLKLCVLGGYFFLFVFLLKNAEGFLTQLLKYINISIWIFTLITLSQLGLQLQTASHVKVDYLLSSSLGNKNFYAETMTLFLPLVMMGLALLHGRWRLASVASALIILVTLIALQTLSTWIAITVLAILLAGILVYMGSWRMLSAGPLNTGRKSTLILVPLLIIALAVPLLYHLTEFDQIRRRVSKMKEYMNSEKGYMNEDTYHTNSVAERIFLWKNAWHMYKDHPLRGAGFDNWKIYNTEYELPFSRYIMTNNVRYIRPHNDLLLILAEGGTVGFVLFMGLFGYALILAMLSMRRAASRESRIILLLSASGLITYLIIACVSLPGDRFYTQVLLFLFFAMICSQYEQLRMPASMSGRGIVAAICLASILSGISIAYIGARRYASEVHLIYALQAQNKKDWRRMGYHAALAKNYFFTIDYTATPIAWYQGMAAFRSGAPDISKYYFEEALRSNPYDLNVLNDLATALQREGDNAKAMKIYDQALTLAPFFSDAFMNKAVLLYNTGHRDQAYQFLHTYPRYHADDSYDHILNFICTNKAIVAIGDTFVSNFYLRKRPNLLRMDSVATARQIPFEQVLLHDSVYVNLK